jgi:hypothetical protein
MTTETFITILDIVSKFIPASGSGKSATQLARAYPDKLAEDQPMQGIPHSSQS